MTGAGEATGDGPLCIARGRRLVGVSGDPPLGRPGFPGGDASTEGTAALDVFLVIGFGLAILLVDRVGRVPLQLTGFAVMTGALCLLAATAQLSGGAEAHLVLVFLGFALFNTFMNMGPNATTFALPAEVFPAEVRAAATASPPDAGSSVPPWAPSSSPYCSRTSARAHCCTASRRPVRWRSSSPCCSASSRPAARSTNSAARRRRRSPPG
ncbi:MFS transporter [Streptomyces sp. FIT100]|uniref:MFS transporter n=1 Tax=Streptomyces sp. FIT100 TaxID=2837956 RepID=UPI0021C96083|nr:MFS transporter [Streptomyces sp. FIT100]UUN30392.1 MFS transporter [Streptomyces sp. FIT100]